MLRLRRCFAKIQLLLLVKSSLSLGVILWICCKEYAHLYPKMRKKEWIWHSGFIHREKLYNAESLTNKQLIQRPKLPYVELSREFPEFRKLSNKQLRGEAINMEKLKDFNITLISKVTNVENKAGLLKTDKNFKNISEFRYFNILSTHSLSRKLTADVSGEGFDHLRNDVPFLRWMRHVEENTADDVEDKDGASLAIKKLDFQCSLSASITQYDEMKYSMLPNNFRKYLQRPQPQARCGIGQLRKPWRYRNDCAVDILFLVKSAPSHLRRRQVIRGTWGSISSLRNMRFATIFLIGNTNTSEEQALLEEENKIYGDILQCEVFDSYRNLPLKVLASFRWLLEGHMTATYYTVTDDDCVMHIMNINTLFRETDPDDLITCGFMFSNTSTPLRRNVSKWFISETTYSKNQYPQFCHGGMWIVPHSLMRDLYCMSEVTERNDFHLEDVYITGILREKLGNENIKPVQTPRGKNFALMYYPWDESKRVYRKMLARWRRWNMTLPWGSTATVAHQPIITTYNYPDFGRTIELTKKWTNFKIYNQKVP